MYGFINGGFTYFPALNSPVENRHVCGLIPSGGAAKATGENRNYPSLPLAAYARSRLILFTGYNGKDRVKQAFAAS